MSFLDMCGQEGLRIFPPAVKCDFFNIFSSVLFQKHGNMLEFKETRCTIRFRISLRMKPLQINECDPPTHTHTNFEFIDWTEDQICVLILPISQGFGWPGKLVLPRWTKQVLFHIIYSASQWFDQQHSLLGNSPRPSHLLYILLVKLRKCCGFWEIFDTQCSSLKVIFYIVVQVDFAPQLQPSMELKNPKDCGLSFLFTPFITIQRSGGNPRSLTLTGILYIGGVR